MDHETMTDAEVAEAVDRLSLAGAEALGPTHREQLRMALSLQDERRRARSLRLIVQTIDRAASRGEPRWLWLCSVLAVVGTFLMAERSMWVFPCWTASNVGYLAWSVYRRRWPQAGLWAAFTLTTAWGWWRWSA